MECVMCGLATGDLPDGVAPEDAFVLGEDGKWRDQACATGGTWSVEW